jgi:hypothetical protein
MISRGPQPSFVGPTPSEAVSSAGSLAQRAAEMFMQGIQEGARNYTAQQQVNAEKERNQLEAKKQQSESDRLHMSLLSQDLQNDLLNNGAMTYVDRKDEWLKYFGFLSNGDPKLAESMYEGGAGALNRMSATEMLGAGLIGKASAEQGTGQAAASPSPAAQGQVQAPVAAPSPVTPGNLPAMTQQAAPSVSPTAQGPSIPQAQPPAAPVSSEASSVSITHITQGLVNNAATQAANSGLTKIAGIAMGNASEDVTPKENAAIQTALKPTIQVLKNAQTEKFLAAGGKEEALQKAAEQLNQALQDPQFASWINTANVMSEKDASNYQKHLQTDVNMQKAMETARHNLEIENKGNLTVALQAQANILKFQQASERLKIMAANTSDNKSKLELSKYSLVEKSVKDYDASMDKFRTDYLAAHKGASDEEVNNYLNTELTRTSSGLRASLNVASQLYGALLGMSAADTEVQLKAQYFLGIPFGFAETSPSTTQALPGLPGAGAGAQSQRPPLRSGGAPVAPNAGPKPVPGQQNKGSGYAEKLGF